MGKCTSRHIFRLFPVPYFSVKSLSLRAAILIFLCELNWGEYKMPVGSDGGVDSVGKNRETATVSVCLMFATLVAPATTTPDWSKGQ